MKDFSIFILNEDGIDSPGTENLKNKLKHDYQIILFGLEKNDIGNHKIILEKESEKITIRDNVKLQQVNLSELLIMASSIIKPKPDLIIFGIGNVHVTGNASVRSENMRAAALASSRILRWGAVPAIVVSLEKIIGLDSESRNFEKASILIYNLVGKLISSMEEYSMEPIIPLGTFLNINYPDPLICRDEILICKTGRTHLWKVITKSGAKIKSYIEEYDFNDHMIIGKLVNQKESIKNADTTALMKGYITIAALKTNFENSSCWNEELQKIIK